MVESVIKIIKDKRCMCYFIKVVREGHCAEMASEESPNGREEVSHENLRGERAQEFAGESRSGQSAQAVGSGESLLKWG